MSEQDYKQTRFLPNYFKATKTNHACIVTDRTWADLEMDHLFKIIDKTITPVGSQVLYKKMRCMLSTKEDISSAYHKYNNLLQDTQYIDKARAYLSSISDDHHSCLVTFILDADNTPLQGRSILYILSLLSIATPIIALHIGSGLWAWGILIGINLFILHKLHWSIIRYPEIFKSCLQLVAVADRLEKLAAPVGLTSPKDLHDGRTGRASVKRALKLSVLTSHPVISNWSIFLNALLLLDPVVYALTSTRLRKIKTLMQPIYEAVGDIDASIAIAAYLKSHPRYCQPAITDGKQFEINAGTHPLIQNPTPNSIDKLAQSVIILGSNMAGKTTFIKMVGINFVLARTLGFSHANHITIPLTGIMTSINGYNSVLSGKSLFFDEISNIKTMIDSNPHGAMLIINELFSGTNTLERIAACQAVLKNLKSNNIVFVTTHDLSLTHTLSKEYAPYYFEENDDLERMFTYEIHSGVPSKGNAIALLARSGFPESIISSSLHYMDGTIA